MRTTEPHSQRNPPMVRMQLVPAPNEKSAPASGEQIESALHQALGHPPEASTVRMVKQFVNSALNGRELAGTPASSAGVYNMLKIWGDARPGRGIIIRAYDIEVAATEMPEADVARLFQLLDESEEAGVRKFVLHRGRGSP